MTNLDSIIKKKKKRHYFISKVCLVKAMVYPVVMYGYERWDYKESWVLKN